MSSGSLLDSFGVSIFTRFWEIPNPKGAVIVVHGASEHSGRYERFALALNAAGYNVGALDQRGHGVTGALTGVGQTGEGGGDAFLADVQLVRDELLRRSGDVPMVLFGHSLGTIISLAYLGRHAAGLAGVILSGLPANPTEAEASAAFMHELVASGLRDVPLEELVAGANDHLPQPPRTNYDWLSRDEAEVDAYLADPYCGDQNPLTYGLLDDILGVAAPALTRLGEIPCDVLLITGDHDPTAALGANPAILAELLTDAGVSVTSRLYPGARHELLNELNRDDVTADVVAWLTAHVA